MRVYGKLPKKMKTVNLSKTRFGGNTSILKVVGISSTQGKKTKWRIMPKIEVDKPIVVIEVSGGFADVVHVPDGISVFVIDHDVDSKKSKLKYRLVKGPLGDIDLDLKKLLKKSGVKL
jgi:hypothetical protein